MSDLSKNFLNKWLEYSGGSRSGSNFIKFEKQGDNVIFHARYIFDWETEEFMHYTLKITKRDYDQLVDNLRTEEHAYLQCENQTEKLFFEWKITEGRVQIRFEIRNSASIDGPGGTYLLSEFRDLLLDELPFK